MDELNGLAGLAANADAGAAAHDSPQPEPGAQPGTALVVVDAVNYDRAAAKMVDLFAGMVTGFAPSTRAIWTDEARRDVAESLAPVMKKYKMDGEGIPCELVFAATAGPLLWQSAKLVAVEMAAKKRAAQAARTVEGDSRIVPEPGQEGAPGERGPAVHSQVALYGG